MPLLPCLLPRAIDLCRACSLYMPKNRRPRKKLHSVFTKLVKLFCFCSFLTFSACLPTAAEGTEKKKVSFSVSPVSWAFSFLTRQGISHTCLLHSQPPASFSPSAMICWKRGHIWKKHQQTLPNITAGGQGTKRSEVSVYYFQVGLLVLIKARTRDCFGPKWVPSTVFPFPRSQQYLDWKYRASPL